MFESGQKIKCLLVHPLFSKFSFWNYKEAAKTLGAKTPSPPLGLITVAALLPQNWDFKLVDCNARELTDDDLNWADLVCVGGMLPQQDGILEVIRRAQLLGKKVAVGGPDPTSQPHIYAAADFLVLGEGEATIPLWIKDLSNGASKGTYLEPDKPDVTQSPVPRFDLLNIADYVQIGIQYSRGCPFNCEFCDIIELYGRKPRTKNPDQIIAELQAIHALGYTGSIDLVDDNFIGNKRAVKRNLLPALIAWNRANGSPFYFCTEASMNLADDEPLLELMREADFRVIFMGIETPDANLLMGAQKTQNTMKPIVQRIHKIYEYGMVVTAGFIFGFDQERVGIDDSMGKLIEEAGINMAMIGLLVALPNTQLTRRLVKEGRLLSFQGEPIESEKDMFTRRTNNDAVPLVDQTLAGLNFVTTRDRVQILTEYLNVVTTVYRPRAYFDRVMRTAKALRMRSLHRPGLFELRRSIRALLSASWRFSKNPQTRWLYWRNVFQLLPMGRHVFEQAMRLMGIYLHFEPQITYLQGQIRQQIVRQKNVIRDIHDLRAKNPDHVSAYADKRASSS